MDIDVSQLSLALRHLDAARLGGSLNFHSSMTTAVRAFLYSYPNWSDLSMAKIQTAIEGSKDTCFSVLAVALLERSERSTVSISDIATEIARRFTKRSSWVCGLPRDRWQGQSADSLKAAELVWFTLRLLKALQDPSDLTEGELSFYRQCLHAEPQMSVFEILDPLRPLPHSLPGTICDRVGVVDGEFVEAAQAEQLIAELDELGQPPPTADEVAVPARGGLLSLVEQSLTAALRAMAALADPLDIDQVLTLVPVLATQTLTMARYAGAEVSSAIIDRFAQLTAHILAVRGRQLPGVCTDLIQDTARNLVDAWDNLSGLGIPTPPFVRELGANLKIAPIRSPPPDPTYSWSRGQWVCWDFRARRVTPENYGLMAPLLTAWVLEGSLDGENWITMDFRRDNEDCRKTGLALFRVTTVVECRFIRLVQMGKNLTGGDELRLEYADFGGIISRDDLFLHTEPPLTN
jgi:hypothetical protein